MVPNKNDFHHLRKEIDQTDGQIISLLCKRAELAHSIGKYKKKTKAPVYRPDREREVYAKLGSSLKKNPKSLLSQQALESIYREIMSASIALEGAPAVAYLGPEASFSHAAFQNCFGSSGLSSPQNTIPDVFRAAQASQGADYGIVPIENSTEGSIGVTLDYLLRFDLSIYAEHYITVRHHLLFYKKTKIEKLQRIYSQGIAQEQCREWIYKYLNTKKLEFVDMPSTAAAAKKAAESKDGAAIASYLAAKYYGLEIIAENIQDNPITPRVSCFLAKSNVKLRKTIKLPSPFPYQISPAVWRKF